MTGTLAKRPGKPRRAGKRLPANLPRPELVAPEPIDEEAHRRLMECWRSLPIRSRWLVAVNLMPDAPPTAQLAVFFKVTPGWLRSVELAALFKLRAAWLGEMPPVGQTLFVMRRRMAGVILPLLPEEWFTAFEPKRDKATFPARHQLDHFSS